MPDDGDGSDLICRRRVQAVDKSGIEATTEPYGVRMRWTALFADMELQLDAADARGRDQDLADLTRAERASVRLADRVRACVGGDVRLVLRDGTTVAGTVRDVGPVWLLLADNAREHLVPLASVATAVGLGELSAPPEGTVLRRLGLGHALRAVARDRSVVRAVTTGGTVTGRLDGVGGDHIDVALVHPDSGRPTGERQVVALAALVLLTSL